MYDDGCLEPMTPEEREEPVVQVRALEDTELVLVDAA
jgi:hypothetical protein